MNLFFDLGGIKRTPLKKKGYPKMPRRTTPLTDTQIKKAKPKEKAYKLFDGGGLFLWVSTSGSKIWRLKYKSPVRGKETIIVCGSYPEISLKQAREWREKMRSLIKQGIDPVIKQNEEKERKEKENQQKAETFSVVAEEFFQHKTNISENHRKRQRRRLELDILPYVGSKPIVEIERKEIIECIKRIEARGAIETAHRVFSLCNEIFGYAAANEKIPFNILRDIDKSNVFKTPKEKNYPTITNPLEIKYLLQAIDDYRGDPITRYALKFAPYVAMRPGNIRLAEWEEFDLDKKQWIIPAEKMKMKEKHIVPLSKQVLAIIEELRPLTGDSPYLFHSPIYKKRPMSDNTLNTALKRLGYKGRMVAHGFRAMFSTIAHEHISEHGFHSDVIERQLAHGERNAVKAAYNHAEYLNERRELMQWWADWLDGVRK